MHGYSKMVHPVKVSVRLFTALRELAGSGEKTLEFNSRTVTLNDVLEELVRQHGQTFNDYLFDERGRVREHLQLLVNGKNVDFLEELKTKLKEGDEVAILPPVGGG